MLKAMIVGIGTDLVEVERVAALLERYGERALHRVFTPAEIALGGRKSSRPTFWAGRFAAKEAAMKALGTGHTSGVQWTDFETGCQENEKPVLRLHGRAAEIAQKLGVTACHVSISHISTHALACVILEKA